MGLMNVSAPTVKKLWENSNPNSEFGAQKISLDLSDAQMVLVVFGIGGFSKSVCVPIGLSGICDSLYILQADTHAAVCANRTIRVDKTGVTFDHSYYMWSTGSENPTLYNFHNIPTCIYKIT